VIKKGLGGSRGGSRFRRRRFLSSSKTSTLALGVRLSEKKKHGSLRGGILKEGPEGKETRTELWRNFWGRAPHLPVGNLTPLPKLIFGLAPTGGAKPAFSQRELDVSTVGPRGEKLGARQNCERTKGVKGGGGAGGVLAIQASSERTPLLVTADQGKNGRFQNQGF